MHKYTFAFFRTRVHYMMALLPSLTVARILNIAVCLYSLLLKREKSGKAPIVLTIKVTNRCNFSCIMCLKNSRDHDLTGGADIAFDALEALLRKNAKYISLVRLHGGEPLFFRKLPQLVDLFSELNLKFAIITNGSLLTPALVDKIFNHCILISISLESVDKNLYKNIRRNGDLDALIENINYINQLKEKHKSRTPILNIAATTFSFNLPGISDIVRFCHQHKIPTLSVSEGVDYNTGEIKKEHLLKNNPEQARASLKEALETASVLGIVLRQNFKIPGRSIVNKKGKKLQKHASTCFNVYGTIILHPNFDISPCCGADPIGNLKGVSLEKMWNADNSPFVKVRKLLRKNTFPGTCRRCRPDSATRGPTCTARAPRHGDLLARPGPRDAGTFLHGPGSFLYTGQHLKS